MFLDEIIYEDCLEYLDKTDLSPLNDRSVLITGANGLIGTYIIYLLHLANIRQNRNIGIIATSRNAPCEKLRDIFRDRYIFLPMDLDSENSVAALPQADFIIHGATYAQPGRFMRNFMETIHLNTVVNERLLEKAKACGARYLFLSSSEVYGEPDSCNIPTPEGYPGLCPTLSARAVYSEAKRMGETLCFAYRNYDGVDARIARISMVYGPGVSIDDERVLGHFLKQALTEGKIVMLDEGSKVRTFCYIGDCMLMLLNILLNGRDFIYNVGGIEQISIRELADRICRLTGSTCSVDPTKQTVQNVKVSPKTVELDISKICSEFSLPPFIPLEKGLSRTIAWNMKQIKPSI